MADRSPKVHGIAPSTIGETGRRPDAAATADEADDHSVLHFLLSLIFANLAVFAVTSILLPAHSSRIVEAYVSCIALFSGVRIGTAAAILAGCLLVEAKIMGWSNSALRKILRPSRSAKHDLIASAIRLGGFSVALYMFFSVGIVPTTVGETRQYVIAASIRLFDSPLLQLCMAWVMRETLTYWFHRGLHTFSFAWELHKYHHAATEFNMVAASRDHVAETALGHLCISLPLAYLGMSPDTFTALAIIDEVSNRFHHSMLNWNFGWFGRWVLMSPVGHRIHHSPLPEHWDKNYAGNLLILDRLFGTWYDGDTVNSEVGVTDNYFERESLVRSYVKCYSLSLRELAHALVTGEWLLSTRRERRALLDQAAMVEEPVEVAAVSRAA